VTEKIVHHIFQVLTYVILCTLQLGSCSWVWSDPFSPQSICGNRLLDWNAFLHIHCVLSLSNIF
jgi:hypothetical protein